MQGVESERFCPSSEAVPIDNFVTVLCAILSYVNIFGEGNGCFRNWI
jgi:hypothetical protein